MGERSVNRWKNLVTGTLGSVAGLLAMRYYWQEVAPLFQQSNGGGQSTGSSGTELYPDTLDLDDISLAGKQYREQESATAAIGRILYTRVAGNEPQSGEVTTLLSYLVHWGYGLFQGGVYGLRSGRVRFPDVSGGAGHGAQLWLLGDELMVPLLGLQSGPTAVPPQQHAHRLGAHLFYGIATALAAQLLRKIL